MVRPTDQKMTTTEKIVCYSQFPRKGGMLYYARLHGNHQGQLEGRQREIKA